MSSILTNNSAMVALQTLKGINNNLAKTQVEISTGKSIGSAKDNAALWAISKVMESDVKGFNAISESLSLGESSVAVARNASESITDLLTDIKSKIVASQEENVDREKIQTDITALSDQISSIVNAAQFNGLNLLKLETDDTGTVDILSSLDRASDGTVSASNITVSKQDLSTTAGVVDATGTRTAGTGGAALALTGTAESGTITVGAPTEGLAYSIGINATDGATTAGDFADAVAFDTTLTAAAEITYVAAAGDTATDVAAGLEAAFNAYVADNGLDTAALGLVRTGAALAFTQATGDADNTVAVTLDTIAGDNVAAGGLNALANINVTTEEGATAALTAVETLIQTSIDAAAQFGSAQGRIEIQSDFISQIADSLKSGIGELVDADMEEASARLQALQVQQQLGVQALSIANQAPQQLLALFR